MQNYINFVHDDDCPFQKSELFGYALDLPLQLLFLEISRVPQTEHILNCLQHHQFDCAGSRYDDSTAFSCIV